MMDYGLAVIFGLWLSLVVGLCVLCYGGDVEEEEDEPRVLREAREIVERMGV